MGSDDERAKQDTIRDLQDKIGLIQTEIDFWSDRFRAMADAGNRAEAEHAYQQLQNDRKLQVTWSEALRDLEGKPRQRW